MHNESFETTNKIYQLEIVPDSCMDVKTVHFRYTKNTRTQRILVSGLKGTSLDPDVPIYFQRQISLVGLRTNISLVSSFSLGSTFNNKLNTFKLYKIIIFLISLICLGHSCKRRLQTKEKGSIYSRKVPPDTII